MPSSTEKINLARQYNVELPEEELSKAIVKDSQIENFINVFYSDKPTAQFTFLEEYDKIVNFSESNIPKSTIKTYSKEVTPKEHIIKSTINYAYADISNIFTNIFLNEASQYIYKDCFKKMDELATKGYMNKFTRKDKVLAFLYKLFKKKYVKRIKVKDISDLLYIVKREAHLLSMKNRKDPECFVICNYKNAVLLGYDVLSEHPYGRTNVYHVTQFFQYDNLKVYVDPTINIKDNTFIIGMKTRGFEAGLHAAFFSKGTEITQLSSMCRNALVPVDIDKTELQLKMKYDIVDVGDHPECNYTKIIVNYTHKFYDNSF